MSVCFHHPNFSKLADMDTFSKSDPFAVIFLQARLIALKCFLEVMISSSNVCLSLTGRICVFPKQMSLLLDSKFEDESGNPALKGELFR